MTSGKKSPIKDFRPGLDRAGGAEEDDPADHDDRGGPGRDFVPFGRLVQPAPLSLDRSGPAPDQSRADQGRADWGLTARNRDPRLHGGLACVSADTLSPFSPPASPGHHTVLGSPPSDDDREVPLIGGDMTEGVVRVGRTVRRPMRAHTPAVHALLRHLEAVGFGGAPRVLGVDAQNREVLTYLPGQVPHRPLPGYALSEATLIALAELQLRYHQAVIGFKPPSWANWDGELTRLVDGPPELVCHCDINLENVIFEPGPGGPQPYALIDFDLARPGTRLVDVIQTLRYWAPLAAPADRDPAFSNVDVPGRIAVFCEAYGLSHAERARLVPVAVRWMRRSRTTITERARRRGGAWTRMLEAGVGERLMRSAAWLERCRPEIEARLSRDAA
jgi:Phosphotransferase enzyme family